MKITDIEIFVVDGRSRPWLFSAVRTDAGITGYAEFGSGVVARARLGMRPQRGGGQEIRLETVSLPRSPDRSLGRVRLHA